MREREPVSETEMRRETNTSREVQRLTEIESFFVGWLFNVPATC